MQTALFYCLIFIKKELLLQQLQIKQYDDIMNDDDETGSCIIK